MSNFTSEPDEQLTPTALPPEPEGQVTPQEPAADPADPADEPDAGQGSGDQEMSVEAEAEPEDVSPAAGNKFGPTQDELNPAYAPSKE